MPASSAQSTPQPGDTLAIRAAATRYAFRATRGIPLAAKPLITPCDTGACFFACTGLAPRRRTTGAAGSMPRLGSVSDGVAAADDGGAGLATSAEAIGVVRLAMTNSATPATMAPTALPRVSFG